MAYYTGSVNSYAELLSALTSACVQQGWAWSEGVLSKGSAFLMPTASMTGSTQGLLIRGGTGRVGGGLANPSPAAIRLGPPRVSAYFPDVTWPAVYHIHVNSAPDEVYVILNFNITNYYWLAFGMSVVPLAGTGLWISGFSPAALSSSYYALTLHTQEQNNDYFVSPVLFGDSRVTGAHYQQSLAAGGWEAYRRGGSWAVYPMWQRMDKSWNREIILSPIRDWAAVASSKYELRIDTAHARYVRLGNIEPLHNIVLGDDIWQAYPFFRKNTAYPDADNSSVSTSGTLGWALRK